MDDTPIHRTIDAVIFDWAGTIVDFGSFAPTQVLVDAFAAAGVAITLDEARGPMGLAKRDHSRLWAGCRRSPHAGASAMGAT